MHAHPAPPIVLTPEDVDDCVGAESPSTVFVTVDPAEVFGILTGGDPEVVAAGGGCTASEMYVLTYLTSQ